MFLKIFFIFILLWISMVSSNPLAQSSGWQIQDTGTNNYLTDVYFINTDIGWIAGYGCIMKTTNGGLDWQIQDTPDYEFWAIQFTDADHGYAVGYKNNGYHGFIYQTTDGGDNWYIQDSSHNELNNLCFVDRDTGYAVGGGRSHTTILKTIDGGANWGIIFDAYGTQLYTIDFVDLQTGWAAGEQGRLIKTSNGFKDMESKYLDIGSFNFYNIQFINPDTGWVFGSNYFFRTIDGGENWQSQDLLPDHNYNGCFFNTDNSGWVGSSEPYPGNRKILFTPDGGDTWEVQDSTLISLPRSIFFINQSTGWAVGPNGMVMATTNGGVVNINHDDFSNNTSPDQFELNQNYPNPFNPRTVISYKLPVTSHINLSIYNILGQKVATLVSEKQKAGQYEVQWDASGMGSGVYLYRLTTDQGFSQTRKLVLLK